MRKAFSLIEVIIAIFIIEVAFLAIAAFYSQSLKTTRVARNETTASNLASGILDDELSKNYDSLTVVDGTKDHYSSDSNNELYSWYKEVDIAQINPDLTVNLSGTDTNMKKITVTVYWQEANEERSFQIASIKTRH